MNTIPKTVEGSHMISALYVLYDANQNNSRNQI